jgi:hypothetical protein
LKASADADRQARAAAEARVAVKARAPIPEGFKYCKACNAIKPLGEFGQHHRAKDGKRKACRACVRKGRALTTPPTPEQAAQAKVAAAKPERRERNRQAVRSWAQRNPQAARARQILMRARRRGAVTPPAMCQVVDCENTRLVAHHSDYSRPLDVLHVCGRHHRLLHGGVALKLKEGVPFGLKRIPQLGKTPETAVAA